MLVVWHDSQEVTQPVEVGLYYSVQPSYKMEVQPCPQALGSSAKNMHNMYGGFLAADCHTYRSYVLRIPESI